MTLPTPSSLCKRDYAAVMLASAASLVYQIALARVLSVVIWYHYAFLVLSLVMLGLAAPGVWFSFASRPQRWLSPLLLAAGLAAPIGVALVVRFGAGFETRSPLLVIAAVLPATVSLGGVLCLLLLRAEGASLARMYGMDLAGAGLGAVAAVPLLSIVPAPPLAAGCGFLPLLALALRGRRGMGLAAAGAALLAAALLAAQPFTITRSKVYDERTNPPILERWTPLTRLTVFDESFFHLQGHDLGFTWGRGRVLPPPATIHQYWLEQDGSAGTPITGFSGDPSSLTYLLHDVTSAGLQLRPGRRVAVIGAGGGRDILAALSVGATEVTAVELNPAIIDLVSRRYGAFSGDPYHLPGVRAVAADGRSFMARTRDRYDVIQLSLTDSWAAGTAGAYALAENNLHTREAFSLYLDRLTEDGLLSVSRWSKELPWLLNLGRAALRERGVDEPERHLAVLGGGQLATMLVSARPWNDADRRRILDVALERGFTVVYPVLRGRRAVDTLAVRAAEEGLSILAGTGAITAVPTDDRPYFFHTISPFADPRPTASRLLERGARAPVTEPVRALRAAMLWVTVIALASLVVVPLALARRRLMRPREGMLVGSIYFAAIGAGFMLIENVLAQRFTLYLGHPSYALSAVIAALLVGGGAGSLLAPRVGVARLRRWGFLVAVALVALAAILPAAFALTAGWPPAAQWGLAWILLLLPAAGMGLCFPLGMFRFGDTMKPWFWAVNGLFGVVASVFSLALSIQFGFTVVSAIAVACYLAAWGVLRVSSTTPAR